MGHKRRIPGRTGTSSGLMSFINRLLGFLSAVLGGM